MERTIKKARITNSNKNVINRVNIVKNEITGISKMQGSSGITLIALIVTIVVLIILATISINVLSGENGLIRKAQQAKDLSKMARIKEEAEMVKGDVIIDNIGSTLTKSDLITALNEHFAGSTLENGRLVVENEKYDIVVKNNLDIVVVKHGDSNVEGATIDISYTIENSGEKTKIIKLSYSGDIEEPSTEDLESLIEEAYGMTIDDGMREQLEQAAANNNMSYEEWLKVGLNEAGIDPTPVLAEASLENKAVEVQTSKIYAVRNGIYTVVATTKDGARGEVQIEITGLIEEKFSQLYTETAEYVNNGKTAWIPAGFAVGVSEGINSIDTGLVITDSVDSNGYSNGNEFVWVPVDDISDIYDEANNAGQLWNFSGTTSSKITYPTTQNSGYREPDVVTSASSGTDSASGSEFDADPTNLQQAGLSSTATAADFRAQLQNEFNSMIASVREYGGFYIGRYETGNLSKAKAVVQKGNRDIENQTWYTMYANCKTIAEGKASVTSSMIWGSLWDATLRWMQASTDPEVAKFPTDSEGKGNYDGTNGNVSIPTGVNSNYAVNNIYDMAGNVFDWTLEADHTGGRVERGGDCTFTASDLPASSRSSTFPTYSDSSYGCRSYLYVTLGAKSE